MHPIRLIIVLFAAVALYGCGSYSQPRPYGYYRIDVPSYGYHRTALRGYPYSFEYADIAYLDTAVDMAEPYWIDVVYPAFNARIHCSYKPVMPALQDGSADLGHLTDDAIRFVFDHAIKADAIPEQGYTNEEQRVYGVYYDLEGNTASPVQFFLTDSTRHFFRAALYYNCIPNADSLAPVNEMMRRDIHRMIESFRWQGSQRK
ncbi:MAG: gliding motility lipoprotein GldD [Paludibacteraceae bacterium]|nr:gliding motility lipoprotein GldD [Paludibacteraceae bacterium]